MSIAVECEGCSAPYKVAEKNAGKKFKCKDCGEVIQIPSGATGVKSRKPPRAKPVVHEDEYGQYDDEDSEEESYEAPRKSRSSTTTKSKSKKKRSANGGSGWNGSIPPFTSPLMCLGVPAALGLVTSVAALINQEFGAKVFILMAVIGGLLSFVANIRGIIVAFGEGAMCGLAYLFVPLYAFYHLVTRWDDHKDAFMMGITGAFSILFPLAGLAIVSAAKGGI